MFYVIYIHVHVGYIPRCRSLHDLHDQGSCRVMQGPNRGYNVCNRLVPCACVWCVCVWMCVHMCAHPVINYVLRVG